MTALARIRPHRTMSLLLTAILLLGMADSVTGSYIVLYGVDRARLSPFETGVFVSASAVSGIAVSTWLGHRYDRGPSRAPALLAVTAPAVGYLLLVTTTNYPLLLVIAVGLLGAGAAAFPQLFALARSHLDSESPSAATRRYPVLRSVTSLAWAIGPVIGAAVLDRWGFAGLLVLASAAFAMVAPPVLGLGPVPPAARREDEATPAADQTEGSPGMSSSRIPLLVLISFSLFSIAQFAGAVALPLYVTEILGRPAGDVGLLFSVCAIAEIPTALGLMLLPERVGTERMLLLATVLFVAYFLLVATSASMVTLVLAHLARGAAIAIIGVLGITYFQKLAPGRVGYATTMWSNTMTVGLLIAGLVGGSASQAFGPQTALLICGVFSALAFVLLAGRARVWQSLRQSVRPQRSERLKSAALRKFTQ